MKQYSDIIQCGAKEAQAIVNDWEGNKIGGVICVAQNIEDHFPRMRYEQWLPVLHTPHHDEIRPSVEYFEPILSFYDYARKKGRVIIHCVMGSNRSVGTFAVILVARHGKTPDEAFAIAGNPGYGCWGEAVHQLYENGPTEANEYDRGWHDAINYKEGRRGSQGDRSYYLKGKNEHS